MPGHFYKTDPQITNPWKLLLMKILLLRAEIYGKDRPKRNITNFSSRVGQAATLAHHTPNSNPDALM